jgi:ABC-type uncharacterized transport system permease subunit
MVEPLVSASFSLESKYRDNTIIIMITIGINIFIHIIVFLKVCKKLKINSHLTTIAFIEKW